MGSSQSSAHGGFSDGGDIVVLAQPALDGFSDGGDIPDGMIAVFAEPAGDGYTDGDNIPEGMVAVLMDPLPSVPSYPPEVRRKPSLLSPTMRPGVRWARPGSFHRSASWCR